MEGCWRRLETLQKMTGGTYVEDDDCRLHRSHAVKRSLSLSSSTSEPDHRNWNPCLPRRMSARGPTLRAGALEPWSPAAQIRQAGGPCRCLNQGRLQDGGGWSGLMMAGTFEAACAGGAVNIMSPLQPASPPLPSHLPCI